MISFLRDRLVELIVAWRFSGEMCEGVRRLYQISEQNLEETIVYPGHGLNTTLIRKNKQSICYTILGRVLGNDSSFLFVSMKTQLLLDELLSTMVQKRNQ